jgi:hypothetical protein
VLPGAAERDEVVGCGWIDRVGCAAAHEGDGCADLVDIPDAWSPTWNSSTIPALPNGAGGEGIVAT